MKNLREQESLDDQDVGLIFCGDFNSVPECGIFKLFTEKFVGEDFVDWSSSEYTFLPFLTFWKFLIFPQIFLFRSRRGCEKRLSLAKFQSRLCVWHTRLYELHGWL